MRCFSASCSFILAVSFLIFSDLAAARPASIWDVNIFRGPAPPPDEGPPLSAGALRDKSKLKYEIIGIVGAYVVWLILTLLLLLFVGTRLRRRTQSSNRTLSMEMMKPAPLANQPQASVEPPLKSPGKMASIRSWASGSKSHAHKQSNVSVSTIDEKILEADRVKNMDEMTKLYAAVMAHDEERSQKARSSGQTSPRTPLLPPQYNSPPTPRSPYHLPPTPKSPFYIAGGPVSPRSPRYPPEFQHLRTPSAEVEQQPSIQPVTQALVHPLAPTPAEEWGPPRTASQTSSRKTKVSPLSLISARGDSADQTKKRPNAISVRGQPISQPLGSATLTEATTYTEEGPASSRFYNPGPPPPTPGKKSASVTTTEVELERRTPPAALSLQGGTASNSSNSLPFRQFYNDALRSAPPTKTTFVHRRESVMGVHPKTGVPQTPYSPYMPFTPMTPVTPRTLVTKKEMKKNKKKEGLKVLTEDDVVLSDEALWSPMK